MMKRTALLLVCMSVAVTVSCSKCQKGASTDLASLVPGRAPIAVVFPDLSRTINDFNALMKKFSVGPAATFMNQAKSELARRLGFDLLKPEEWKKIGMDPGKGLALALWPGKSIIVAGVSDDKVFETEIKKRMKELLAADQVSTSSIEGQTVTTIGTKLGADTAPQLYYVLTGGYVVLSGANQEPKLVAETAAMKPEQSMAKAKWFTNLTSKVSRDADLLLLVNGKSAHEVLKQPEPEAAEFLKSGLVIAFSMASAGLTGEAFWGLDQEALGKLKEISADVPDAHLERYLPGDTLIALKVRANAQKLLELMLKTDPGAKAELDQALAQAKEKLGVDLRAGTVDNLSGNAVWGFSLGKPEHVSRAIASKGQAKMGDAFGVDCWVQLKDGAAFSKLLKKALDAAGDRLPATRKKLGELSVLAFPEHNGVQANVLHQKDLLGLCLGAGCAEEAASLLTGKGSAFPAQLSKEARKLFDEESLVVGTLKFGQLLDVLSGLDAASLGEGGMMVKMVLDMVIGAVKNLRELTAVIRAVPGGVVFKGHLRIQ
jgi:hypothetical protein